MYTFIHLLKSILETVNSNTGNGITETDKINLYPLRINSLWNEINGTIKNVLIKNYSIRLIMESIIFLKLKKLKTF